VWMLAIGWAIFGVRPTRPQALGAVLGLSGVLLVISRGTWQTLTQVQWVVGDLYMLLAAISWAVYSWLLARPPATMLGSQRPGPRDGWDWAGLLLLQMVIGSGFAGLFALAEHQLVPAPLQWGPALWAALLFVALGPSLVAYRCWGLGVAEAGPTIAAFFANLTPLFTAIMSAALLGEAPRLYHAIAFLLIIGGIAVSSGVLRRPATSGSA
jgi:drug/metabolite transporter (DMT)-like permease